ncbi:fumarylacetoacetase [Streptomyces sp. ST2-7A]|uniref:fumarylacetoacetase n=1 Tax=Streptomyces sp. ST2-7A TaxID=2907214 RepID=UPI001F3C50CA|nr:fumarylacetoacetase [Streptomyces sp. ST2-7A]MCE7078903.1 fumarylacetoacetase [Streptomyces sp. ST2-7A]
MSEASTTEPTADDLFGPDNLPYGVYTTPDAPEKARIGVRLGDRVLDAGAVADLPNLLEAPDAGLLAASSLDPLLAAGRPAWRRVRAALRAAVTDPAHRARIEEDGLLIPLEEVTMHLPFTVADYVDFYSSEHHATNVGRLFRPDGDPLTPNWKHLPIGYHGRAGTVVVSGTPVVRPTGQRRPPGAEEPLFGPSARLDIEAEVGFVVGAPSRLGEPVPMGGFRDHVFGLCLLNDWSARDVQAWEYVPLGPFLGKSFATSVSAWITPLEALEEARTAPPARTHPLLPYLDDTAPADADGPGDGYDLRITVRLNGEVVAEPPFSAMYWTAAQQLAHLTVNGASLRTGDLYASGTVSGPEPHQLGCLLELTRNGREPIAGGFGKRTFLEDGDEVTLTAWAPGPDGTRIGLGEVVGRIDPAR